MKFPWKKKQDTTVPADVPQEVHEYYQSSRRQRVGVAWVLAAVTLLVTILLAVGLFFGGRWVYRQVFDGGRESDTSGTQNEGEATQTPQGDPETANPQPAVLPGQADNNATVQPQNNANSSQNSSTAPTAPQSTTPQTGPAPEIPRTGPETSD